MLREVAFVFAGLLAVGCTRALAQADGDVDQRTWLARGEKRCDRPLTVRPIKTADGSNVYVEASEPIVLGREAFLFGKPTIVWRLDGAALRLDSGDSLNQYVGAVVNAAGLATLLTGPKEMRAARAVHAAPGASGVIHVVWGTTSEPNPLPTARVTSLWYAEWRRGTWAPAVEIATSENILINRGLSDGLRVVGDTVYLTVPIQGRSAGSAILVARRVKGVWSKSDIPLPRDAVYASVSQVGRVLALTYLSSAPGTAMDVNSILVRESQDGGSSWSNPEVVVRSGRIAAYQPHIAVLNWREILVFRTKAPDSGGVVRGIAKRANAWQEFPGLPVFGVEDLEIAEADRWSDVLLTTSGPGLVYARMDANGWSRPDTLGIAGAIAARLSRGDRSRMLFFARAEMTQNGPMPSMFVASLNCR